MAVYFVFDGHAGMSRSRIAASEHEDPVRAVPDGPVPS
jgi:hypothetical protein